jgi:hypothetical protein
MSQPKIAAAVVGLVSLLLAAGWGFQRYSVPDPWEPYTLTVREYLAAGLRRDSVSLVRRSAAPQPMAWVQEAIRRRPATVAGWAQQLHTVTGFRTGETVTVALAAASVDSCSHLSSVTAQLLNHSGAPRLLAIASPCTRGDLQRLLPYQRRW